MDTDKVTIHGLFEKQRRYLVPIFQRGYVWTMGRQWEPLWEDLLDEATTALDNLTSTRAGRKHFLGAIVLNPVPPRVKQVAASEIIDGQQRLMTLQIILAVLRDIASQILDEHSRTTLDLLTRNFGVPEISDERFKVWPTYGNQDDFRNVMSLQSANALEKKYPQYTYYRKLRPPRPLMVDAYLFFNKVISSFLRGEAEDGSPMPPEALIKVERAEAMFRAVTEQLQLVTIELEKEDDPQIIFETLNARGEPLEPADLIRNFVFLFALRHDENLRELYDRYWKEYEELTGETGKFWKEEQRQGRLKRSRLDLFLFHYVTCQVRHEIKVGHLYQEFKTWWGEDRSCLAELDKLNRSSAVFKRLSMPTMNDYFGVFARRMLDMEVATVYPLVLYLAEKRDGISAKEFEGMLADIESYLVRRMVCNMTTKNYNQVFMSLLRKLSDGDTVSRLALQQGLLELKGESSLWPDNETFRKYLVSNPIYQTIGPNRTHMILRALESTMLTAMNEKIELPYRLTVEHVMPQTAMEDDYPYPLVRSDVNSGHQTFHAASNPA